jgi:hypothetical protein
MFRCPVRAGHLAA